MATQIHNPAKYKPRLRATHAPRRTGTRLRARHSSWSDFMCHPLDPTPLGIEVVIRGLGCPRSLRLETSHRRPNRPAAEWGDQMGMSIGNSQHGDEQVQRTGIRRNCLHGDAPVGGAPSNAGAALCNRKPITRRLLRRLVYVVGKRREPARRGNAVGRPTAWPSAWDGAQTRSTSASCNPQPSAPSCAHRGRSSGGLRAVRCRCFRSPRRASPLRG